MLTASGDNIKKKTQPSDLNTAATDTKSFSIQVKRQAGRQITEEALKDGCRQSDEARCKELTGRWGTAEQAAGRSDDQLMRGRCAGARKPASAFLIYFFFCII